MLVFYSVVNGLKDYINVFPSTRMLDPEMGKKFDFVSVWGAASVERIIYLP